MATLNPSGRYGMYLRRSRADLDEERRGAGETLARHYHMLMELSQHMGVVIGSDAIYREIVSGDTLAERPQAQRMLTDVESGMWDGIFAADVDRLARGDTMDQGLVAQTFLYSHTLIITPYKIYDPEDPSDREFFEMKLFFARREYDQIKRRLQSGRVNAVKEGLYAASTTTFGYIRHKLPDRKGWTLVPDPETAPAVRMAFDWYLHGMDGERVGTIRIAHRLNDMGFRTIRGQLFTDGSVIKMLSNPIYCGYVRWNQHVQVVRMEHGERIKRRVRSEGAYVEARGLHEPLITREEFDEAQRLRVERRMSPSPSPRAHIANPFAGIAKCGLCGHALILRRNDRRVDKWSVIRCSNKNCSCSGVYLSAFERAVLQALRQWVVEFSADEVREPDESHAREDAAAAMIEATRRELARLDKQMSSLRDLLEQGIYTPDVYLQRSAELSARINDANARIKSLSTTPSISREDAIRAELPRVRDVLEVYAAASTPGEKNALLKSIIRRIDYTKRAKTPEGADPLSLMSIDVWPNLPTT